MLTTPRLFTTDAFVERFEETARENLRRALRGNNQ
jgi:predicted metal-dependent HD superfamily phosphohydrolase